MRTWKTNPRTRVWGFLRRSGSFVWDDVGVLPMAIVQFVAGVGRSLLSEVERGVRFLFAGTGGHGFWDGKGLHGVMGLWKRGFMVGCVRKAMFFQGLIWVSSRGVDDGRHRLL